MGTDGYARSLANDDDNSGGASAAPGGERRENLIVEVQKQPMHPVRSQWWALFPLVAAWRVGGRHRPTAPQEGLRHGIVVVVQNVCEAAARRLRRLRATVAVENRERLNDGGSRGPSSERRTLKCKGCIGVGVFVRFPPSAHRRDGSARHELGTMIHAALKLHVAEALHVALHVGRRAERAGAGSSNEAEDSSVRSILVCLLL
mmetsp:Transcript_11685/g.36298  ORF Transcript_11685/g.36298 Transcript_11685/m.36298 type:complete len:203 (-) Transcript_11685:164-772(-)